ncbi:hypothetical protein N780_18965 [Pontibacillus chungwhensis BH030062]|uniref:YolD-like family protein n=1 Tax=Pontibacillus chungwhensis BH030062 TaxID=1385513 RepID=A0A0A2UY49_9BACI|nr:YolD-like family protein [Pontibacillus chungwhensis]KGP91708.1 hypothetical protein N780_18965 [Pontibacillus chungwhensis BH030062]
MGTYVLNVGGVVVEKERNIKKRGTIKWTSLMLSEHIEMLKEVWKEDERVKKGLIAEDKAVEIDFLIRRALNDSLPVRVCYFIGDSLREESVKVTAVDATDKKIKVIELTYKYECMVDIHAITDIEIL